MSLHPGTGALTVDRLGPNDLVETFGYLDRDPIVNVYLVALVLRDALAQPRDEYWAARRDGEIEGVLYLGLQSGAVLPCGEARPAMERLARQAYARLGALPRRFQVIGGRAAVAPFLETLAGHGVAPRLSRSQSYLAVRRGQLPADARCPELRPARSEDYDEMFRTGAALRAEELDEDPRDVDGMAYARRVEEECRDGHTWVLRERDGIVFRASVSAVTADSAQVSGVYTAPARRNQGLARRGLGELCARLLERSTSACLFVNDFNAAALAVYRRLGFARLADWHSAFYGPTV